MKQIDLSTESKKLTSQTSKTTSQPQASEPAFDQELMDGIKRTIPFLMQHFGGFFSQYSQNADTLDKYCKIQYQSLVGKIKGSDYYQAFIDCLPKVTRGLPTIEIILSTHRQNLAKHLGLPSAYEAYQEACNSTKPRTDYDWSHPIVYHAGVAVQFFNLDREEEKKMFPKYEDAYLKLLEQVMDGVEFPKPIPQERHIESDRSKPLNKTTFENGMADLMAEFKKPSSAPTSSRKAPTVSQEEMQAALKSLGEREIIKKPV